MIQWIQFQHQNNQAEIASLCIGAFILAQSGLIGEREISTHWAAEEEFRALFPDIKLNSNNIITDDNGIYSSGGAFSFLNLILYLVEKYCGREVSIWASKMFEIEIDRVSQNQFMIFNTQKSHFDEPILDAQIYIEKHFNVKISVEDLAARFAISRRNFIRRFSKATNNTPIEYIQRVKIEAAKKILESKNEPISLIMEHVGYSDGKAFRSVFKKFTGISPMEYKNKYNRLMTN